MLDISKVIDATIKPADHSLIEQVIAAARPAVQADGGDLEWVGTNGDKVIIRLSGKCTTCTLAGHTLGGVRRRLMEVLGKPVRVVPAPIDA
jgi:Fe-S cluster biogenesis protein NfuA